MPSSNGRYFENTINPQDPALPSSLLPATLQLSIKHTLELILANFPAHSATDFAVYSGTAGLALLFFRLHILQPDLNIAGDTPAQLCHDYLSASLNLIPPERSKRHKHIGFLGSPVGPLALAVVVFNTVPPFRKEVAGNILRKRILEQYHPVAIKRGDSEVSNELLFGRAGYLYALGFIAKWCPEWKDELLERAKEVVEIVIEEGKITAETINDRESENGRWPLMWEWHGKNYLGAIHGAVGIIAILLQFPTHITSNLSLLLDTLTILTAHQFPTGNFPSSIPSSRDELVHFCHGSPGFIPALTLANRLHPSTEWLKAAINAGDDVWIRGLLKKGIGLCHGVSGNALSLLDLFHALKSTSQSTAPEANLVLKRAYGFANFAGRWRELTNRKDMRTPDTPWSLWEGCAGGVWVWAEIAWGSATVEDNNEEYKERKEWVGWPCFTDLML